MILLLRLICLIIAFYLIRRLFASLLGNRKRRETVNDSAMPSNHMVKDPVCGMYMDSRLAVRLENRNKTLYFCSEKCRTKYLDVSSGAGIGSTAG
jgi:YHS domain-containing protein